MAQAHLFTHCLLCNGTVNTPLIKNTSVHGITDLNGIMMTMSVRKLTRDDADEVLKNLNLRSVNKHIKISPSGFLSGSLVFIKTSLSKPLLTFTIVSSSFDSHLGFSGWHVFCLWNMLVYCIVFQVFDWFWVITIIAVIGIGTVTKTLYVRCAEAMQNIIFLFNRKHENTQLMYNKTPWITR